MFRYPGHEKHSNSKDIGEKEIDFEFFMEELTSKNAEFGAEPETDISGLKEILKTVRNTAPLTIEIR